MRPSAKRFAILLHFLVCLRPVYLEKPEREFYASDAISELQACANSENCVQQGRATRWSDLLTNKPPCLTVHRVWWSPRAPPMPAVLVTQLSVDRVPQLTAQCATWRGPLAAALHIALSMDVGVLSEANRRILAGAELRIDAMFNAAEAAGNCQLRVMLIYEFIGEGKAISLYPVNSLRNYARLMADSDIIANIDVDMVPSLSLSLSLMEESTGRQYLEGCRAGHLFVLPAFDVKCGGAAYADAACLKHKLGLVELFKVECVAPFRKLVAPASHNVTDFMRWTAVDGPYNVTYKEMFEPWFLSARARTPWFDYRFKGYGKNKIVQAMYMNATGSRFMVHASAFLIHRPHNESRARKEFLRAKFGKGAAALRLMNGSIFQHISHLYKEAREQMAQGTYSVMHDPGMERCLETLPWWQNLIIRLGSER